MNDIGAGGGTVSMKNTNILPELLFEDREHKLEDVLSESEMFDFPVCDGALWGQIMRPDGSFQGKRPCVIVLHGFPGGNRNDDIAHALCRIGCVVLILHHRGAWGSPGKYLVSNCIEDIKQLAEHVRSCQFGEAYQVDPNAVYLLGHSMGGNNALNAGKELPWLRGLILLAPYDSTCYIRSGEPERLMDLMKDGAKYLNCDGAEAMFVDILQHAREWNFEKAAEAMKEQNLLILSGAYDDVAPEKDMVLPLWNAVQEAKGKGIQRHCSYPAGHALLGCRVMALREVVQFLKDTL